MSRVRPSRRGLGPGAALSARSAQRKALARPLFLVLPAGWKLDAAKGAPDLWSVRKWVLNVPHAILEATAPIAGRSEESARSIPAQPAPAALERMQGAWQRLANQPPGEVASLRPGWSLVEALLEGHSPQALEIAAQGSRPGATARRRRWAATG